jgi:hypothetical protein
MNISLLTPWTRILSHPHHHLNDFCLFQARDQSWHVIGIQGSGTWASETTFFHFSSQSLFGPYQEHPALLAQLEQGASANPAPQKHAPFIVARENHYQMFFRRPPGTNLRLVSPHLDQWPAVPEVVFEENDARDACIQYYHGRYHWYYCQWRSMDGLGRSTVRLRTSADLEHWSAPVDVLVDYRYSVTHAKLECPFVVQAAGAYWLFVRDRWKDQDCITVVYRSDRPDCFALQGEAPCAELPDTHAAELVEQSGRWYIARVSGPPDHLACAPRQGGWIDLAQIGFDTCA